MTAARPSREDRLVTVCSACLTVSCWQARFMCQRAQTANVERKTIRELRALDREHPSNWTQANTDGDP